MIKLIVLMSALVLAMSPFGVANAQNAKAVVSGATSDATSRIVSEAVSGATQDALKAGQIKKVAGNAKMKAQAKAKKAKMKGQAKAEEANVKGQTTAEEAKMKGKGKKKGKNK